MKIYTFSLIFLFGALFVQAQSVLRYNFNNVLSESNGAGPTLTVLGNQGIFGLDTLNEISGKTKTVYRFEKNSGFQFDNAAAGNFLGDSYTIEIYFVFDNLSSWKRVVDWKNRKTDKGAYVFNGQLNFYNFVYSGQAPVIAGEYTYYVITRNAASGKLLIYTDAGVQIDFIDSGSDGIIDSDHVLNFFFDDLMVPNEASSGAVALLNMYNYVLDSATIKQNWDNLNSQVFGLNERGKSNTSIGVFPNPANGHTNIDLSSMRNDGTVQVAVLDMMGTQVYTGRTASGNDYLLNLKTLDLPSGLYTIKAESDSKVSTQKLVIQR
jgi:hypothetical protein